MRRISKVLVIGGIAGAVLFATPSRSQEGDGTAAPPPAGTAPAPEQPAPTEPAAPPPAAPQSPPATSPTTPTLPENQKITAVLVSTSSNSIVIRKEDSSEVTFHVASPRLIPKNMRAGEMVVIIYREVPSAPPEAVRISMLHGGGSEEPSASAGRSAGTAGSAGTASSKGAASEPARTPVIVTPPPAPEVTQGTKAAAPGASGAEKPPAAVAGAGASAVEKAPVLPESTTDSTAVTPPPSPSPAPPASQSPTSESSSTTSSVILPAVIVGVLLVAGVAGFIWYSKKKSDRPTSTSLKDWS